MKKTEVRVNLQGLEDFRKKIGDSYRARVGILAGHTSRNGGNLSNAEIGAIQMFGSLTGKIPPRDFLMMPIESHAPELLKAMRTPVVKAALESGDVERVFKLLGVKAEELVQLGFDTAGFGQWPANKPSTIAAKGSAAPLIDTAQLRRAVASDVVKKGGGALPGRKP